MWPVLSLSSSYLFLYFSQEYVKILSRPVGFATAGSDPVTSWTPIYLDRLVSHVLLHDLLRSTERILFNVVFQLRGFYVVLCVLIRSRMLKVISCFGYHLGLTDTLGLDLILVSIR